MKQHYNIVWGEPGRGGGGGRVGIKHDAKANPCVHVCVKRERQGDL